MNFKVDPGARLSLDNENGGVEVLAWDKNEVDVNGAKYASSESQLKDIQIESNATPTLVTIRTLRQHLMHGNSGARYTIRVPKHMILDRIHSTNGSITVEGVAASATLSKARTGRCISRGSMGASRAGRRTGRLSLQVADGDARLNSDQRPDRGRAGGWRG